MTENRRQMAEALELGMGNAEILKTEDRWQKHWNSEWGMRNKLAHSSQLIAHSQMDRIPFTISNQL